MSTVSDTAPAPFSEHDDPKTKAVEAAMIAQGEPTTESIEVDYFAFDETIELILPDGKQKIMHRILTEGARRKYLNGTNRDVKLQRASGDAIMRMAPGDDKAALLKSAIVGWDLRKNGKAFAFTPRALDEMLEAFPPKIIDLIHKDVVKHNPWLLADLSVEDIDREIEALQEQREAKVAEEAGKAAS